MRKLVLLLAALICTSGILVPAANAIILNIDINDHPYYVHGPGYWSGGIYYVWIPGHYGPRHHWIHGHYRPR